VKLADDIHLIAQSLSRIADHLCGQQPPPAPKPTYKTTDSFSVSTDDFLVSEELKDLARQHGWTPRE
jgi:hypothetical protein